MPQPIELTLTKIALSGEALGTLPGDPRPVLVADAIPGARHAELDSGHLAPFEQPEAFLDLLTAFIDIPRA